MPKLFDAYGRQISNSMPSQSFPGWSQMGPYPQLYPDRMLKGMSWVSEAKPEHEQLRHAGRIKMVAYLRKQFRTNPIFRAIVLRYALAIGSPVMQSRTSDNEYNDQKELVLQRASLQVGIQSRESLRLANFLVACEECIAGEVFLIFNRVGRVQLIPAELVGSPDDPSQREPNEYDGIVYDDDGAVIQYRIGTRIAQPGVADNTSVSFSPSASTRVDARFVHHVGTPTRVEEGRPVPPFAAGITALGELEEMQRTKMMQYKVQAAFALFITKHMDPATMAELMENEQFADSYRRAVLNNSGFQQVGSGSIMYGYPGENVQKIEPTLQASDFNEYERQRLHFICSVIGIPPEEALLGYSRSNYSSSRADKNRWQQTVTGKRLDYEDQWLRPWQAWICERARIFGELGQAPQGERNRLTFIWPPIPTIDETKDVVAARARIEAGISSPSHEAARLGRDGEEVARASVRDAKFRAKLLLEAAGEDREPTLTEITAQMANGGEALKAIAEMSKANEEPAQNQ